MNKYMGKTFKSLEDLKDKLESDGYDILNASYSTLDIIDKYVSDGIVTSLIFCGHCEEFKVYNVE